MTIVTHCRSGQYADSRPLEHGCIEYEFRIETRRAFVCAGQTTHSNCRRDAPRLSRRTRSSSLDSSPPPSPILVVFVVLVVQNVYHPCTSSTCFFVESLMGSTHRLRITVSCVAFHCYCHQGVQHFCEEIRSGCKYVSHSL